MTQASKLFLVCCSRFSCLFLLRVLNSANVGWSLLYLPFSFAWIQVILGGLIVTFSSYKRNVHSPRTLCHSAARTNRARQVAVNVRALTTARFLNAATEMHVYTLVADVHPHGVTLRDHLVNRICDICRRPVQLAYQCVDCDFDCCLADMCSSNLRLPARPQFDKQRTVAAFDAVQHALALQTI